MLPYDDPPRARAALARLLEQVAARDGIFLKVDPAVPRSRELVRLFQEQGLVPARERPHWGGLQPVAVCRLELGGQEAELLRSFHPKTRYNIGLAQRKGVQVRPGGREDLPTFHDLLEATAARQGFGVRGLVHLQQLWDHLVPAGMGRLLLAEHEGDLLAGAFLLRFGPGAWYLYGATSDRKRQLMPMYLVQWEAIRWALREGCRFYDFLGVSRRMDPLDRLYGLYRFKRGFGPRYVEFLGEWDFPADPRAYAWWRRLEPACMRAASRLGAARRLAGRLLEAAARGGMGAL